MAASLGGGAVTGCEQGRGFRLTRNSCQISKLAEMRLTGLRICTGTWLSALLMVTERTAFLQNAAHILGRLPGYVDADGAGGVLSTAAPATSCLCTHFLFFKLLLIREAGGPFQWLWGWYIVSDSCKVLLVCFQSLSQAR